MYIYVYSLYQIKEYLTGHPANKDQHKCIYLYCFSVQMHKLCVHPKNTCVCARHASSDHACTYIYTLQGWNPDMEKESTEFTRKQKQFPKIY